MSDQLLLEPQGHVGPQGESIEQDFWRFHFDNPQVYEELVRLARRWREHRPGQKLGIKMLFEVARWTNAIETQGEPFKLNNSYTSYFARLIMTREPDLVGVFELRRLNASDPFTQAA